MKNDPRPRFAAVGESLPAALLVWKLGSRLIEQAGHNPSARRWARMGAVAAGFAGLAVILVGVANSVEASLPPSAADLDQRLEEELQETFPASDAPVVTRRS